MIAAAKPGLPICELYHVAYDYVNCEFCLREGCGNVIITQDREICHLHSQFFIGQIHLPDHLFQDVKGAFHHRRRGEVKFDAGVNAEFDFYTTDTSRSWVMEGADPALYIPVHPAHPEILNRLLQVVGGIGGEDLAAVLGDEHHVLDVKALDPLDVAGHLHSQNHPGLQGAGGAGVNDRRLAGSPAPASPSLGTG